eukprot:4561113-Heterocapsa_arctica.AAC.1
MTWSSTRRSDKTPRKALAIEDKNNKKPATSEQVGKQNKTAAMAEVASESEYLEEEESEEELSSDSDSSS